MASAGCGRRVQPPPHAVERGGIKDDQYYTGDPLSPGWASKAGSRRLTRAEAKGLVTIPVLSVSYADASALFDALGPKHPATVSGRRKLSTILFS